MEVYQFRINFKLKQSINADDIQSVIAKSIDQVLSTNDATLTLHNKNIYKLYSMDGFYPYEIDKIYFAGNRYTTTLRTINYELALLFEQQLPYIENFYLKAINCDKRLIQQKRIERIYSITSCVIKCEDGRYWKNSLSLDGFEDRLKTNLIKKYNYFTNSKLDENFQLFQVITFKNKVPIATKYKDIKLLGDKIEAIVDDSPQAQNLMHMALGTGIGELNARGFGFINFRYL